MHERVGLAQAGNHIIQQATPIKEHNPKDNSKVPTQKWTHENVSRNMAGLNQEMCPGNKDFACKTFHLFLITFRGLRKQKNS